MSNPNYSLQLFNTDKCKDPSGTTLPHHLDQLNSSSLLVPWSLNNLCHMQIMPIMANTSFLAVKFLFCNFTLISIF